MNKYINLFIKASICLSVLISFSGCNEDEIFEKEQYEKVLCLLSGDDHVFSAIHSLDEDVTTGNFSVIIGGSNAIDKDVTVTFELDTELLPLYNKTNFDIDTEKFAQLLNPLRYTIPSLSLTIKANSTEQYGLLPVNINTAGLSSDTTYMIPLKISNISNYRLNEDKMNVLYRIRLKNYYASQEPLTYYNSRGTTQTASQDAPEGLSATKQFLPLSKNTVRFYPGRLNFDPKSATVSDIEKNAVIIQINDDKSITFIPYGTIQIEKINQSVSDNLYEEIDYNGDLRRSLYLHYRYRLQNAPGEWGEWVTVNESLRRVE